MTNQTHSRPGWWLTARRVLGAVLLTGALLLLAACTLPSLGGKKDPAPQATAEADPTQVAGVETGETAPEVTVGGSEEPANAPINALLPPGFVEFSAQDFTGPEAALSGVILFSSASSDPFVKTHLAPFAEAGQRHLWAISPDGLRGGRISPEGLSADLAAPATPSGKVKVLRSGFDFSSEAVEMVDPPAECDPATGGSCDSYQFSPTGRALAYFSGPEDCGRTLNLYDLDAKTVARSWPHTHWMYFLRDGSIMMALGSCEEQVAYLYVPKTGKQAGVEKLGTPYWNPSHTAVVYQVQGELPVEKGLWGFNLENSRVFLWLPNERVIQDSPTWLPDGRHFAFNHRVFQYDPAAKEVIISGPRQIIIMNAWSRDQRLVGYDSMVDYHLCPTTGEPCEQPYTDWLQVQRTAFKPQRIAADALDAPETRCLLYGQDCAEPPETWGINWQTRKQYPWAEALVPEPQPAALAPEPDLESAPIYRDPADAFALYLGADGRSLWYVPRDREPSLWVVDGKDFVYLP